MSAITNQKTKRPLSTFVFSDEARATLKLICESKGWKMVRAVEMSLFHYAGTLTGTPSEKFNHGSAKLDKRGLSRVPAKTTKSIRGQ